MVSYFIQDDGQNQALFKICLTNKN